MVTYYVIYDKFTGSFIKQGRSGFRMWTTSLSFAKHFTSEWSANKYISNCSTGDLGACIVKKIQRY